MAEKQITETKTVLIEGLNNQLNREVSTFLRYMLQAASIKGAKAENVRRMYLEEAKEEVRHAQCLANQIELLGGIPKLDPDLTPPPRDIKTMLARDAEKEQEDVRNYRRLAEIAEAEDYPSLKIKMEELGAEEDEHKHEMRHLL